VDKDNGLSKGTAEKIRNHYLTTSAYLGLPIASTLGFSRKAPKVTSMFKLGALNRHHLWNPNHALIASLSCINPRRLEESSETRKDIESSYSAAERNDQASLKYLRDCSTKMGLWYFKSVEDGRKGFMQQLHMLADQKSFHWETCKSERSACQAIIHKCDTESSLIYKDASFSPLVAIKEKFTKARSTCPTSVTRKVTRSSRCLPLDREVVLLGKRKGRADDKEDFSRRQRPRKLSLCEANKQREYIQTVRIMELCQYPYLLPTFHRSAGEKPYDLTPLTWSLTRANLKSLVFAIAQVVHCFYLT